MSSMASSTRGFAMNKRRLRPFRHVTFTLGFAVSPLLVLTAALSLVYTPQDPLPMSITSRLPGPSAANWLGTDQFGRDLLSRIMTGAVTSISVGVIAVGIGMGIGGLLGMLSGDFGGWLAGAVLRLIHAAP